MAAIIFYPENCRYLSFLAKIVCDDNPWAMNMEYKPEVHSFDERDDKNIPSLIRSHDVRSIHFLGYKLKHLRRGLLALFPDVTTVWWLELWDHERLSSSEQKAIGCHSIIPSTHDNICADGHSAVDMKMLQAFWHDYSGMEPTMESLALVKGIECHGMPTTTEELDHVIAIGRKELETHNELFRHRLSKAYVIENVSFVCADTLISETLTYMRDYYKKTNQNVYAIVALEHDLAHPETHYTIHLIDGIKRINSDNIKDMESLIRSGATVPKKCRGWRQAVDSARTHYKTTNSISGGIIMHFNGQEQ